MAARRLVVGSSGAVGHRVSGGTRRRTGGGPAPRSSYAPRRGGTRARRPTRGRGDRRGGVGPATAGTGPAPHRQRPAAPGHVARRRRRAVPGEPGPGRRVRRADLARRPGSRRAVPAVRVVRPRRPRPARHRTARVAVDRPARAGGPGAAVRAARVPAGVPVVRRGGLRTHPRGTLAAVGGVHRDVLPDRAGPGEPVDAGRPRRPRRLRDRHAAAARAARTRRHPIDRARDARPVGRCTRRPGPRGLRHRHAVQPRTPGGVGAGRRRGRGGPGSDTVGGCSSLPRPGAAHSVRDPVDRLVPRALRRAVPAAAVRGHVRAPFPRPRCRCRARPDGAPAGVGPPALASARGDRDRRPRRRGGRVAADRRVPRSATARRRGRVRARRNGAVFDPRPTEDAETRAGRHPRSGRRSRTRILSRRVRGAPVGCAQPQPIRRTTPATAEQRGRHRTHPGGSMLLEGKTIVVTGGNSGIGEQICLAAAAEGANIVIDYVAHPEATDSLIARIEQAGGHAVGVDADITSAADLHRMVQKAVDAFGSLDVLVNNAGIEDRKSLLEETEEGYDKVMAVNMKSAFFGTQAAAKQFIAQGNGGLVLNISSVHEDWPMPGNLAYCVSKGGMRMLARSGGVELGPHGVRIVNIAPGAVDTPINTATTSDPEKLRQLDDAIPLGRPAKPHEIAEVVVFLASGKAAYMTSTTVTIDGGISQGSVGL
ncbi:sugar dehydrogenase [Curtobacterium sp. ER1/6]|nr:sugar dehydrogenase [Curtobacterium sp. ER1/6]